MVSKASANSYGWPQRYLNLRATHVAALPDPGGGDNDAGMGFELHDRWQLHAECQDRAADQDH